MSDESEAAGVDAPVEDLLWYTDRSRIVDSLGQCQMIRYLGCHFGPTGYGIQRKGTKLPLMTGIGAHDGLAPVLQYCANTYTTQEQVLAVLGTSTVDPQTGEEFMGTALPDEVVRASVAAAQAQYWQVVEARGFAYMKDEPAVKEIVQEQNYLIEGMIWAWVLEVLPEMLRRGRIVEVEHEGVYVIGCTCGLGDGILGREEHVARGCEGIGYQNRPDFVLETWQTAELEYHEFKTTGADSSTWRGKFETSMQTFASTLDVERRMGRPVNVVYIHGLIKGKREGEYQYETGKRDGIVRQQSRYCYGYRKPASPPMEPETWAAEYEWWEEAEQKNKRLPKAFKKAGVWELPDAWVPEGMSKGEYWAKWMPASARRKTLAIVGPLKRQEVVLPEFLQELVGEENRWREVLWQLYERIVLLQDHGVSDYWPHPDFQALLHHLVPRSYECKRFGERYGCQFETICFKKEGWADPLGSGLYIPRRPHHAPELEQAVGRGLLLPEAGMAETEDEA